MQKNKLNTFSIIKIVLAIIIIMLVSFAWHNIGIIWSSYMFGGKVVVELNYIIASIILLVYLFLSLINKKDDAINKLSSRLLINCLLISFAYKHNISLMVPLIIIAKDVILLTIGNYKEVFIDKVSSVLMYIGFLFVLLGNIPFEFLNLAIDQGLILVATCIALYSCLNTILEKKEKNN